MPRPLRAGVDREVHDVRIIVGQHGGSAVPHEHARPVFGHEPRARRLPELVEEHPRRPRIGERLGLERHDERYIGFGEPAGS